MDKNLRLQVILSALDKVTAPLKKIQTSSGATAKALKETSDRLKELQSRQEKIAQFRDLHTSLKTTSGKLQEAQQRVSQLSSEMEQAGKPTTRMTRDFNAAVRSAQSLKEKHQQESQQLQALRTQLSGAGISTRNLSQHERLLRKDIAATNVTLTSQQAKLAAVAARQQRMAAASRRLERSQAMAGRLAGTGAGLVAAGTATGAPVAVSVSEYAKAEDSATQLKVALMRAGSVVPPQFEKINTLAMRLGDRLPGATADFQDMMTMLNRQGISTKSILGGMGEATAYLAVQMKKAPTEAAEFAAKMQDATRTTEANMMGLMDVIQRSYYLGVDDNNMLSGFTKLGPAMDVLRMKGLAGAQALAPLLVMADQAGMAGEQSGNAYRKIFQLSMDASKVAKANGLIGGKFKLNFSDGKGEFGGLENLFAQLDKLKTLSTEKRLAVMKKIFGDDAETLQAVTLLMEKGVDGYREVQGRMAAQASLQERVNTQLGTLRNLWDATSGTFTNALVAFGDSISPELKTLTEWLGVLAEKLGAWARENPVLAGAIMKLLAVLAILLATAGGLTLALAGILGPIAILKFSMATLGMQGGILTGVLGNVGKAIMFIGRAMVMNPIGLLVTALAVAAYLVYKYWDDIKAAFSVAMEWFAGLRDRFFNFGVNIIHGLIDGIKSAISKVVDTVKSVGASVAETYQDAMGIHSPSRVFTQFGGYTMQGLSDGLEQGQNQPIQIVSSLSRKLMNMGAGLAIGSAAMPAMAFDTRAPLTASPAAAGMAGGGDTIHIHIHAAPGMDELSIARTVESVLNKRDREKQSRRRAALHD